ncbi:MAG: Maf family protein [Sphingomonadaceae bacterium]
MLASRSSARRAMLAAAGVPHMARTTGVDEEALKASHRGDARELARALARAKALGCEAGAEDIVIGADQVLETGEGAVLSKPGSRAEAAAQIEALAGRTHRLHSAAAAARAGDVAWQGLESAALTMRPLSRGFIARYVEAEYEAIRHSLGGYRIEGPGVQLFEKIEGSHFAILGLPLIPLLGFLREEGALAS